MNTTTIPVERVPAITRREAVELATVENRLMLDLLRALDDDDWSKPTDCTAWDVRALAAHVLGGTEAFATIREWAHQMRAGKKAPGDRPFIDGMTEVQVRERAGLSMDQLLDRLADMGPRSARARGRVPGLFRRMPMKEEFEGVKETWSLRYLLEVILTRDTWMHRVDIARATGRPLVLTAEHDGRIVAEVVAEWARRHGQPFTLHLEGPAGGTFTNGDGGADAPITMDAVEFCRVLSGREPSAATGLLATQVPF